MSDWYRAEPGRLRMLEELRRLRRRARSPRHLIRAFLITIVLTSLMVVREMRRPHRYYASVTVNMMEGVVRQRTGPVPKNELRTYIADASLNRKHVQELLDKYDLYPRLRAINAELAVKEFWSDMEIEVYQNQFAIESDETFRRSARVQLTYAALDSEVAINVINDVRKLVSEFEVRRAKKAADEAMEELTAAMQAAEDITNDHRVKLALKKDELAMAPPKKEAPLQFQVFLMNERLIEDARRLDALTRARTQVDVTRQLSNAQSQQLVTTVDQKVPAPHNPNPIKLAILAFAVFLFGFPLATMGVCAFDSRIYDANDIRRLGVQVVGHVPPFSGADVGTLPARRGG